MLYEKASEPWHPDPRTLSEGVVLCIGPEGGWEDGEVEQARAAGYEIFSLGPWILRAETAAIAAVSIIQHHINLLMNIPLARSLELQSVAGSDRAFEPDRMHLNPQLQRATVSLPEQCVEPLSL